MRLSVLAWSIVPLDVVDAALRRKVCCYASSMDLENAHFHCQRGGARRIRDCGVRSVVAYVEGDLIAASFTRNRLLEDLPDLPDATNLGVSAFAFASLRVMTHLQMEVIGRSMTPPLLD